MLEPRVSVRNLTPGKIAELGELCIAYTGLSALLDAPPESVEDLPNFRDIITRVLSLLFCGIRNSIEDATYLYDDSPKHLSKRELNRLRKLLPR